MSENNPVMVPCSHCKGAGKIQLSELQTRVLMTVVSMGKATTDQVAAHPKMKKVAKTHSAMNNCLRRLFRQGLLTRTRLKRIWTYVPAARSAPAARRAR